MFGRERKPRGQAARSQANPQLPTPAQPPHRHGRRPMRSSMTGPGLVDPRSRFSRFESAARATVQYLQHAFPTELATVQIGFQTAPTGESDTRFPMYYSIDRASDTIVMFRMPIQRARVLHVEDEEHRRYFIEHCVYQAVCEYLGREPWELLPGRFEHF